MTTTNEERHNTLVLAASSYRNTTRQLDDTLRQVEQSTTLSRARMLLDAAEHLARALAKDIKDELQEDAESGKEAP